jgi:hypothetical protein
VRAQSSTRPPLRGNRCECSSCLERFTSTSAFDKHRRGRPGVDRRCLTSAEMELIGMCQTAAGFWITRPMPRNCITADATSGDRRGRIFEPTPHLGAAA